MARKNDIKSCTSFSLYLYIMKIYKNGQVRVVVPLLFQAAFNLAPYPPVLRLSFQLFGLAPVGSHRFTKSWGTSPSTDHPLTQAVSFLRPCPGSHQTARVIHFSHGGGNFLSWACALPSAALPLLAETTMKDGLFNFDRSFCSLCRTWRYQVDVHNIVTFFLEPLLGTD